MTDISDPVGPYSGSREMAGKLGSKETLVKKAQKAAGVDFIAST